MPTGSPAHRRGRAMLVTMLLVVGLLASCSSDDSPPPPADPLTLAPGSCLSDTTANHAGTVDADLESLVPCTEPHLFLVYEVADLDLAELGLGDLDAEQIAETRATLQDVTSELGQALTTLATATCRSSLSAAVGFDGAALDALAVPVGSFAHDVTLTSEEDWTDGKPGFVCSLSWRTGEDFTERTEVTLPEGVTLADWFSDDFPTETRRCEATPDGAPTPCDDPHWRQTAVSVNANAVLAAETVQSLRDSLSYQGVWSPEAAAAVDQVCASFLPIALGDDNDALAARGDLGSQGWADLGGTTSVLPGFDELVCGVTATDSAGLNLVGDVFGSGSAAPTTEPVSPGM
ncbi:MAG: septum formation family protein [Aeromicrobium sp.]|uniref:septum formation family protein n=1 Tax=Aeromicrobium sp. TaxID=1871063 RepID=UPI0039E39259